RAVRLGDREVDPHRPRGLLRAARDAGGAQLGDERVVRAGGQHRHGRDPRRDGGTRDVHPLAAGLGRHRGGAQHGAPLQGTGEGDRPVDARVGRQGEDHATTTSTPCAVKVSSGTAWGSASVTRTSTSPRSAKLTVVSRPTLVESARTTTRLAERTSASLTAASSKSGVEKAGSAVMQWVPRKATSTRTRCSVCVVIEPTA